MQLPEHADDGPQTAWYANGRPRYRGAYRDGQMDGFWEFFRSDGSLMRSGSFRLGRQVGRWTTYRRDGIIVRVTEFPDSD